jgi:hypothetical protein
MASTATLSTATSTTVNLTYGGTQTITALYVGGVLQAAGVYGASANNPSGIFIGSGTLTVTTGGYPPITISSAVINNNQLMISWTSVSGTSYNVFTTPSLNAPATWTQVNSSPIVATGTTMSYTLPGNVVGGQPHIFVTVQQ